MEPTGKVARGVLVAVATALVAAFFSLCVNLFLLANQYKTVAQHDEAARLTRQINLLLLLRDELSRIQNGIEHGNFEIKASNGRIQSEGYEWPTAIWSNLKWNFELLNVEPSLVQLLAGVYGDVAHAEALRTKTTGIGSAMSDFMEPMMRGFGASEKDLKKLDTTSQLDNNLKAYAEAQARIQQQLPATLAALDIKINELRARLPR
jgi:hypothetical protein